MGAPTNLHQFEALLREKYEQYARLKREGELAKAGEVLWSAIMILLSALGVALRGAPVRGHREAKLLVKRDLARLYAALYGGDPAQLVELFGMAERLHANFYHGFLDEEELRDCIGAAERLAAVLMDMARRLLGARGAGWA